MYWFPFRYLGTFSGNVNVTLGKLSMGTFRERSLGTFFMVFGERSENVLGTFPCWLGSRVEARPGIVQAMQDRGRIILGLLRLGRAFFR